MMYSPDSLKEGVRKRLAGNYKHINQRNQIIEQTDKTHCVVCFLRVNYFFKLKNKLYLNLRLK